MGFGVPFRCFSPSLLSAAPPPISLFFPDYVVKGLSLEPRDVCLQIQLRFSIVLPSYYQKKLPIARQSSLATQVY